MIFFDFFDFLKNWKNRIFIFKFFQKNNSKNPWNSSYIEISFFVHFYVFSENSLFSKKGPFFSTRDQNVKNGHFLSFLKNSEPESARKLFERAIFWPKIFKTWNVRFFIFPKKSLFWKFLKKIFRFFKISFYIRGVLKISIFLNFFEKNEKNFFPYKLDLILPKMAFFRKFFSDLKKLKNREAGFTPFNTNL